jgi:hypothetical protein
MWNYIFFTALISEARKGKSPGVGTAILFFMALAVIGTLLGNAATLLFSETGAR